MTARTIVLLDRDGNDFVRWIVAAAIVLTTAVGALSMPVILTLLGTSAAP